MVSIDAVREFEATLGGPLEATGIGVMQINVGKVCNQRCAHCHVDAGPERRETMTRETAELCIDVLRRTDIPVVDITGGAPELCAEFRYLVTEARKLGRRVIDRCNLTILLVPSQADLIAFLAAHEVEIVASLPCYLESNVDGQRGEGVYAKSIEALRRLNAAGYGIPGSSLRLNLVYNPTGPSLPPAQEALEADYQRELQARHGVSFHSLYVMANMPISRFLGSLQAHGKYEVYMEKLAGAFRAEAARGVMCREMVSVGWDGTLYDCDFNQMLEMPVGYGSPRHIRDFDAELLRRRRIVTGKHCYGCTAGQGSSCGGATV
ncbi:MAG: arsenosugar biosynthesis radical SAM (seleno)protein ArsS [Bryobacteraceae bacterium]